MPRKKISEKEKQYIRVFLDFANAKDPKDAGKLFIHNIQKAFGYSDEITERALSVYAKYTKDENSFDRDMEGGSIEELRQKLRDFLNMFINKENKEAYFNIVVKLYEDYSECMEVGINRDFIISEIPVFNDIDFSRLLDLRKRGFATVNEYYYKKPIAFCIISALKNPIVARHLKKCLICGDFFLSDHPRNKACSDVCKKEYDRNYMKEYMRDYPR